MSPADSGKIAMREDPEGAGSAIPPTDTGIAYFSMEVGFDPGMPTYSGGLGMLAGDTLRSAADLRLPLVGMTLLHRQGYFFQRLAAAENRAKILHHPLHAQPQFRGRCTA